MELRLIDSKKQAEVFDIKIELVKSFKNIDKETKKELKAVGFEINNSSMQIYKNILYLGAKNRKSEDIKILFSDAIKEIIKTKFSTVKIDLNISENFEVAIKDVVEGLILGAYKFNKYKSKKEKNKLEILIDCKDSKKSFEKLKKELNDSLCIVNSVNMVRDIVNTTPEDFFPKTMAKKARKIAKENNLTCKVFGEEYLEKKQMKAMLAVGQASRHESQLIHLSYKPKTSKGKIVLVGKGLTYDSGGLSLKADMVSMKCDKSGASAVLGVMNTVSKLNLEYEVHGIIGAVENMIGGNAFKPDDILKAKNGVTIEVTNTDAEGRLVLADCLCYAQDEIKDIDYIFDIATLTGACIIGLGEYTTGVMGHSQKMKKKLLKASAKSGELIGILPFNRYLPPMIKSQVADIVNSTTSKAGAAITASLFLDNFIKKENKKKWLHLDIAGAAYREKTWGYNPYGASGAGVRLLLEFIKDLK